MSERKPAVDAWSIRAIVLGAVDVVALDVFAVSEMLLELSYVLNGLLAVCIGFVVPNIF